MDSIPVAPPTPPQLSSPIAGFWKRFLGVFIDGLVLGAFGWVLGLVLFDVFAEIGAWGRAIGFAIALFYFGLMNSRLFGGQTLGKRVAKTRVVNRSGEQLTIGRSFLRYLVLGVPFFLNGAKIPPEILISSWFGTLLGIVLFGFGGAIIYLIVFNRRTRQSLHDLIAGSYVVKTDTPPAPIEVTIWQGHYFLIGLWFLIVGLIPTLVLGRLVDTEFFKPLLALQQQIAKEPEVAFVGINEGQNTFTEAKGTQTSSVLNITVALRKNLGDYNPLANKVAAIVLRNHPRAFQKDRITVIVIYGYDIGISSFWRSTPFSFSPQQWQEKLGGSVK